MNLFLNQTSFFFELDHLREELRKNHSMSKKLYVGNLNFKTDETQIREVFTQYGTITDIHVAMDKMTGRPRGFAFVTIQEDQGADQAIESLNGTDLDGRNLVVNEARPREEGGGGRSFGGGGGGGRSGGGRSGGGRDNFRGNRY